jgi:hypothetical protein
MQSKRSTFTCQQCGDPFTRVHSQVLKRSCEFCSSACRWAYVNAHPADPRVLWEERASRAEAGCWAWTGEHTRQGYGRLSYRAADGTFTRILAHRFAWEMVAGPIPRGGAILHVCDRPICVRNDDEGWYEINGMLLPRRGHLCLGTVAANNADMAQKGRVARGETHRTRLHPDLVLRGEGHGNAVLTDALILDIRAEYATGTISQAALARKRGIAQTTVSKIVRRVRWAHVQ